MDDIHTLRTQIDKVDAAWVVTLAERFKITGKVGKIKATQKLAPVDTTREEAQLARIRKIAEEQGVNPILAQNILRLIIDESVKKNAELRRDTSNK